MEPLSVTLVGNRGEGRLRGAGLAGRRGQRASVLSPVFAAVASTTLFAAVFPGCPSTSWQDDPLFCCVVQQALAEYTHRTAARDAIGTTPHAGSIMQ